MQSGTWHRWIHLVIMIAGVALPAVWVGVMRLSGVSDGTLVLPVPGTSTVEINQTYGHSSGLKKGDIVLAVQGVAIGDVLGGAGPHTPRRAGDVQTYQIERRGGRPQSVSVTLGPYPFVAVLSSSGVLLVLVFVLLSLAVGVFLARPGEPSARALLVVGLALPWVVAEFPLGLQVVDLQGGPGLVGFIGSDLAACVMWSGITHFGVVFPVRAQIIARRPRLVWLCYAAPLLLWGLSLPWRLSAADTPVARLYAWIVPSHLASLVVPAFVAIRLFVGYRRTDDVALRRWLRWIFALFLVGFATYSLLGVIAAAVFGHELVPYQWLVPALVPGLLAIFAAILRYRLFDIEIILTRSLLVGGLTVGIATAYAAIVLVLPRTMGAGPPSTLAALLIGGAITAGAFAVRKRLARRITMLVYGHRNNPHAVVEQLGRLNTAAAADQLIPDVVRTLALTLRLPYVRLELRGPGGVIEAQAQFGHPTRTPTVLAIGSGVDVFGELELDAGPGREPFGPADNRLLSDLASHLTEAGRTVLLARALQRSRERLIFAREEERRRLRRDLHDGVGPSLAALAMRLEIVSDQVARNPDAARVSLERLAAATHGLIGEVRHIVDDLRPAALDQLGLVSAIRESALAFNQSGPDPGAHGFAVLVRAEGPLDHLPAAVEVAAFRIAIEAVSNAARYSGAASCIVTLRRATDLFLDIEDDGGGLQPEIHGSGVGLASMRERAAELGGTCSIGAGDDGAGTAIRVRLPVVEAVGS